MTLEHTGLRATGRNLLPVLLAGSVVALALSSCSQSDSGTVSAEAPVTVNVSPLPATSLPPATVEPTAAPTTETTQPPTTPLLTLPPTTLPAPTTTEAPTTTVARNVEVVGIAATPFEAVGSRDGEATRLIQERLLQLGFWNSGADGDYGLTTVQAVMAFQKYLGLEATGKVDESTAAYLQNFPERAHGTADTGDLVEVDKDRQLLFIVRDGMTIWTFNTSTATGLPYHEEDKNSPGEFQDGVSITPNGLWKVNRERPEGWWEGDLGQIYRPKYFRGGVAVHGSNSIPNYPASHGCVRLSVPAMDFIWDADLMPMKSVVWVHGA